MPLNGFTWYTADPDELEEALSALNNSAPRVEKGDVIIALSEEDYDKLLLPSSLVCSTSRFAATLHPRWTNASPDASTTMTDRRDASQIVLCHISMQYCDGEKEADRCWTLDLGPYKPLEISECEKTMLTFYRSSLADGIVPRRDSYWPTLWVDSSGREAAVREYKTLFQLLLGQPILNDEHLETSGRSSDQASDDWRLIKQTTAASEHLANVICRAQYHAMLPEIASQAIAAFESLYRFWEDVMTNPQFYIGLAIKLRWVNLFEETFKLSVGSMCLAHKTNDGTKRFELPDSIEFPSSDLMQLLQQKRNDLSAIANRCKMELERLCLSPHPIYNPWKVGKIWYHIHTIVLRPRVGRKLGWNVEMRERDRGPERTPAKTREDRIKFLAKSIFQQWLIDEAQASLSGRQGDAPERLEDCYWSVQHLRMWSVCKKLLAAAEADDISMFGYKPGETMTKWFSLTLPNKKPADLVEGELRRLVREGADIVKTYCPPELAAKGDVDFLTHVKIHPEEMPWAESVPWENLPRSPFGEITDEWAAVVGLADHGFKPTD